jgi:hypothetical protein
VFSSARCRHRDARVPVILRRDYEGVYVRPCNDLAEIRDRRAVLVAVVFVHHPFSLRAAVGERVTHRDHLCSRGAEEAPQEVPAAVTGADARHGYTVAWSSSFRTQHTAWHNLG